MFDYDDRVPHVPQLFEAPNQAFVIALVQAYRGFVQNIEHVDEPAAYLRGQTDTLALAAAEALAAPAQTEIAQADRLHKSQARADLLHNRLRYRLLLLR